jgi:hypothetical protein
MNEELKQILKDKTKLILMEMDPKSNIIIKKR